MTKEELEKVRNEHYLYIYSDMDAYEAVSFVADLLKAEANSLREHEPYATRTIERHQASRFPAGRPQGPPLRIAHPY